MYLFKILYSEVYKYHKYVGEKIKIKSSLMKKSDFWAAERPLEEQ